MRAPSTTLLPSADDRAHDPSHDAYHCGELSQALGIHGLPQIDLWRRD
ncbi:MAG: hypothetical protein ABIZ34_09485 [Candidatus Limnocylindrales bacterium]